ncbi:hypothetical protein QT972_00180 [Microcoleus sp. herbarium7]|uniref:hypothetical protein n=1 Tax=Microcoleus sp. herbarium7 TaxID=3055435 RepID=UPI002FCEB134
MPNDYGRAFNTANFLPNLAALKAINFGASDPLGCWFVVPNSQTNNIEIWVWEPTAAVAPNEIDVIRPDSVAPGSPGRCIQRLKFNASQFGGFLASLAQLSTTGIVERTSGGGAVTNAISAFGKTLLNLVDAAAARVALALGNVATRNIGTTSGTVRDATDSAYTNARTPTSHAASHAAGGVDEIQVYGYLAVSANITINATHERLLINVNATSAAITITLPVAATVGAGWLLKIRKSDVSANVVTISRSGSDTINDSTSFQITSRFQTIVLLSLGGTSWGVIGSFQPVLPIASGGTGSNAQNFVELTGIQTIGGSKTFINTLRIQDSFPGFWLDETDHTLKGAFIVLDGGLLQIQRRATNFGVLESTLASINVATGILNINTNVAATSTTTGTLVCAGGGAFRNGLYVGGTVNFSLPTSSVGLSAGSLWRNGNTVSIV